MALKALMLKKRLDLKKAELEQRRAEMQDIERREAELAAAIDEVRNEDEQAAVQESVESLITEKDQVQAAMDELDTAIHDLETELAEAEARQNTELTPAEKPHENERSEKPMNELRTRKHAETRARVFGGMSAAAQNEMIQREDVQAFLTNVKNAMRGQTRAINNVGLTIPDVMLGLIRQNVLRYSKLYGHVRVDSIAGEGRVLITGDIPEAVWTECCANLNELSLTFYEAAFGCWKLGGYFVACNANLEDSDIDLAAEILSTLGQSIGYSYDKTILYGTGTNMPKGIIPSLAETSQPAGYPAKARPWADLHTSNIKTIANTYTGVALFQQLALAAANAKGKYSRGEKVWVMNEVTYSFLIAQAMNFDAAGAITANVNGTMPVLGGAIEVLPDSIIPDYNILMGYMDLYRLVERAGERFATSEEYFFLSDQTVFKATVRWDGQPVVREAFVLIGVNGTNPTTSATFAGDGANAPVSVWLPATATVAVDGTVTLTPVLAPYGVKTTYTWTSGTVAKATVSNAGVVTGVAAGSSVITVKTANGLTATCTVTVTST